MAFGIVTRGHNNSIGVNSDWANLVFVGKATWTGADSFFPADHQSFQFTRNFGPSGASTSQGPIAGTGVKRFFIRAENTTCGTYTVNLTTPDDNGVFTFFIDSPTYPHVFCNSTNIDITASVFGLRETATTGANGFPRWEIVVSVAYPSGLRANALSAITLYCFSAVYDTPGSVGIKVFDSDSKVVFNSDLQPLRVKDVITITSTTLVDPSDLASIIITDQTLSNPVVPFTSMSKPASMNVDWARYTVRKTVALGPLFRFVVTVFSGSFCTFLTNVDISFSQPFIVTGVRPDAANTGRLYSIVGLDVVDGVIGTGTSTTTTISKTEQLPISIPVIDGADYD